MFIHERGDTHFGAARVAVFVLSALALSIFAIPALAATINVNTTSDELNTVGNCSLREAIQSANTDSAVGGCEAGSGADIIIVPAGTYTLTIPRAGDDNLSGSLVIESDVELIGAGRDVTIIDAAGLDRVIDARCPDDDPCPIVTIRISAVTLINGTSSGRGGGLRVTGGSAGPSATSPVVTLEDSIVSDNTSDEGGGVGNEGVLIIRNTIIHNNTATIWGGGGVDAFGVTTIEDSLISNNTAEINGGGVHNNALMTVRRSLFSGNGASGYGGGFMGLNDQSTLLNNTFVDNNAGTSGGGVACGNPWNGCNITMSFSTLAGNTASGGAGNAAVIAGSGGARTFAVKANIFSEDPFGDTEGAFASSGENIVETVGGATGFGASDFLGVDPLLGPLADNGGATQTRLPSEASPALDAATCTDVGGTPVNEDQRGFARPFGAACDVGAVEFTLFSIGGTVAGLAGSGLVLQNNGGDDLLIAADGSFTFATVLADGSSYDVTVLTQPGSPSQTCSVSNGSGTVSGADVTDVTVTCVTNTFTVGGTVSGLEGSGLVLQNNGNDDLSITADGSFTFATALADGSNYNVTVLTQPGSLSQTCSVTNGAGTLAGANVSNVAVSCTTDQFTVGGTVTGLQGDQVVLQNNGGDDRVMTADGGFSFTAQDDGSSYAITVLTQPGNPSQTCSVTNGSGTLAGANVSNVAVSCITDQFTVSGTVTGLQGDQVVLQNNGGDDRVMTADGGFSFTAQDDGSSYAITVLTQPTNPSQTCRVTNGSGTLSGENVADVAVQCWPDSVFADQFEQ